MKKPVIITVVVLILVAWCARVYALNGSLLPQTKYPEEFYDMHEKIEVSEEDDMYDVFKATGYSFSVEDARIIDADDYANEIGMSREDFNDPKAGKYLEITLEVSNSGDYDGFIPFMGLPVSGTDWDSGYDPYITLEINTAQVFVMDDGVGTVCGFILDKGNTETIKIAYSLRANNFINGNRYENLEDEKMWLMITMRPVCKRILITF